MKESDQISMTTFSFHGYTVRSSRREDLGLAERWIKADPEHRDTGLRGEFWLLQEAQAGIESFLVEDRFGPVLFFKTVMKSEEEAEIHLLFPPVPIPAGELADRNCRIMNAMLEIFPWVEKALALRKTKAVLFMSKSKSLIRFVEKRLGFVKGAENERGEWKMVRNLI